MPSVGSSSRRNARSIVPLSSAETAPCSNAPPARGGDRSGDPDQRQGNGVCEHLGRARDRQCNDRPRGRERRCRITVPRAADRRSPVAREVHARAGARGQNGHRRNGIVRCAPGNHLARRHSGHPQPGGHRREAGAGHLVCPREETAATRSLLNTARPVEENPLLVRPKELEALEKIATRRRRSPCWAV